MKNIISSKLNAVISLLVAITFIACSKDDLDINNLNETIVIRHKGADMPAYIHGNASEKVFLIMLHGGPGGNGLQYRVNTFKSEIEKNNAVVYFDQRGAGNSQGSFSKNDVSVDIMAEDVIALAKVIKAKYGEESKLFLIGHSWGGTLGPATLIKDQSYFSGWIDVDGSHSPKSSYNRYRIRLKEIANQQIALGNSIDYWKNVIKLVESLDENYSLTNFYKLNKETHKAEEKLAEDSVINKSKTDGARGSLYSSFTTVESSPVGTILGEKGLWEKISFTDQLKQITIPSLVLWGKYDIIVPTINAEEAFNELGSNNKELFIFEKSGHSPMFSEPSPFAEKVINFINKHK